MAVALRGVRHHLRQALPIVGKTAACQHHGARFDVHLPVIAAQHRAGHALRPLQQPNRRRIELKAHSGVEGGSQQTGDQRIAIDQMLPPSGAQPLPAVAQQAAGGIQRGARRAGGVKKCAMSAPPAMPIPARLMVSSGGRSRWSQSPSRRPS